MLIPEICAELESGGAIETLDHHAIGTIGHYPKELVVFAEHEVAPGRIEFPKQPPKQAAVQAHVSRSGNVDLELTFAIIAFFCAHQDGILELVWVRGDFIGLAAELAGFLAGDGNDDDTRVLQAENNRLDRE